MDGFVSMTGQELIVTWGCRIRRTTAMQSPSMSQSFGPQRLSEGGQRQKRRRERKRRETRERAKREAKKKVEAKAQAEREANKRAREDARRRAKARADQDKGQKPAPAAPGEKSVVNA